jgi:hypothetical protein
MLTAHQTGGGGGQNAAQRGDGIGIGGDALPIENLCWCVKAEALGPAR